MGMLLVFGGETDYAPVKSVECLDMKDNTWSSLCDMPESRRLFGAAVVGGKVYVVGGEDDLKYAMDSVHMYDPSLDTWTTDIPSMLCGRSEHGVAVLNDCIYAVGGCNTDQSLDTAEVLDLKEETPQWRNIANMNSAREGVAVAAWNGKIYAMGGRIPSGTDLSSFSMAEC